MQRTSTTAPRSSFTTPVLRYRMYGRFLRMLMLAAIDDDVIRAVVGGRRLIAELGLTLPNGTPVCAAVRPPRIRWRAAGD